LQINTEGEHRAQLDSRCRALSDEIELYKSENLERQKMSSTNVASTNNNENATAVEVFY
jgi:hypothetical protein